MSRARLEKIAAFRAREAHKEARRALSLGMFSEDAVQTADLDRKANRETYNVAKYRATFGMRPVEITAPVFKSV